MGSVLARVPPSADERSVLLRQARYIIVLVLPSTKCRLASRGRANWLLPVDQDAQLVADHLASVAGLDDHMVARFRLDRAAIAHAVNDPAGDDVFVVERRTEVHAHFRLGVLLPAPSGLETRAPDDRIADLDRPGVAVLAVLLCHLGLIEALDVDAHLADLPWKFAYLETCRFGGC